MSLPPQDGYARVTFSVLNPPDQEPMTWSWDLWNVAGDSAATIAAASKAHLTSSSITVAANFHVGWTFEKVHVLTNFGGMLQEAEELINLAGAAGGVTPPSNVSLLLQKKTAVVGRKYQGRSYLPPFCVAGSGVDRLGIITPSAVTILTTRWNNMRGLYDLDNTPVVIAHADGSPGTPVTSIVASGYVATQRRRLSRG